MPDSNMLEKGGAVVSLAINIATAGLAPNIGGALRAERGALEPILERNCSPCPVWRGVATWRTLAHDGTTAAGLRTRADRAAA